MRQIAAVVISGILLAITVTETPEAEVQFDD
jgi:hypothetical protein